MSGEDNNEHEQVDVQVDEHCCSCDLSSACCCCACWDENRHALMFRQHHTSFYLPNFAQSTAVAIFGTMIPISLRAAKIDDSMTGLIVALVGVGRVFANVPTTLLSQRYGPLNVMIVACLFATLLFALPAVFYDPTKFLWSYIVAQIITGVSLASFATSRLEIIQTLQKAERNILTSALGGGARAAFVVGPLAGGIIYTHAAPEYSYVLAALCCGLSLMLCFASQTLAAMSDAVDAIHAVHKERARLAAALTSNSPSPVKSPLGARGGEEDMRPEYQRAVSFGSSWDDGPTDYGTAPESGQLERHHPQQQQQPKRSRIDSNIDPTSFCSNAGYETPPTTGEQHENSNNSDPAAAAAAAAAPSDSAGHLQNFSSSAPSVPRLALPRTPSAAVLAANDLSPLFGRGGPDDPSYANNNNDVPLGLCGTLQAHWKNILVVGFIALSVTALRASRRLALTFRALDAGYNAAQVGAVIAGSFSLDVLLFWVSSILTNRWGFLAAGVPLLLLYGASFLVLSFDEPKHDATTLFISCATFGLADSAGTGLVLAIISDQLPRAAVGIGRMFVDGGLLIGPLLTGILSSQFSLAVATRALAGWSLVGALFMVVALPRSAGRPDTN